MASKTKAEIDRAKAYSMLDMLEQLGVKITKDKKICCPFHHEKTPSASIGSRNVLNCFGCGTKNVDTITLYVKIMGTDFPSAVDGINQLAGSSFISSGSNIVDFKKAKTADPLENYKKFLGFFKPYRTLKKEQKAAVEKFLNSKCLDGSVEILNAHKMDIGIDLRGNICWHLKGFGIVVSDKKRNMGSPLPMLLKNSSRDTAWVIVEGITDALSAYKLGHNVVCLNSVNNILELLAIFSNNPKSKKFHYIIAVDTDRAGAMAMAKLVEFFQENEYEYSFYNDLYASQFKDLNELYIWKCRNN